jgi:hypothetical protein
MSERRRGRPPPPVARHAGQTQTQTLAAAGATAIWRGRVSRAVIDGCIGWGVLVRAMGSALRHDPGSPSQRARTRTRQAGPLRNAPKEGRASRCQRSQLQRAGGAFTQRDAARGGHGGRHVRRGSPAGEKHGDMGT